jgi:glycosyltransferase involved in cell wall biosynthesis
MRGVATITGRTLRLLSVVAPMFNEEETAREFYRRVCTALEGIPFELLVVDDGSTDGTPAVLRELAAADKRLKVLRLSRNFGHQAAITAGLDHARGDAVVMIDADLQDPPEVILELLERWHEGADVVYAVRRHRDGETRFKLTTARWFYRLMAKLSRLELQENAGDFRLLDRRALDAVLQMPERNRYLRGMTVWVGFTQAGVSYRRDARYAGKTKFSLARMVRFSMDAVASFSHFPLQLATVVGFLCAAGAFVSIPVAVAFRMAGQFVPGITTVVIAVLLIGGIELIALGIIGEYIGRIYDEVKRRPAYFLQEHLNASEDEQAEAPAEALPASAEPLPAIVRPLVTAS